MLTTKETGRKILHLVFGLLIASAIFLVLLDKAGMLAVLFAGISISLISKKANIPLISWFLDRFERENVKDKFPGKGTIYFFAGTTLALFLFTKDVAAAAVIILALGDSFAPLVGQFGRIKHPLDKYKSIEGVIAGIVAASAGASLFVSLPEAIIASTAAMIAEGMRIVAWNEKLDDNLVIPLVAGAVITLMRVAL